MPGEDDAKRAADEQAAAAKAAAEAEAAADEERKRQDRAAVTRGLLDGKTMNQLSSSGDNARSKRGL